MLHTLRLPYVALLVGAAFISLPLRSAQAADERPNILFCFADDWGRYASAYAAVDSGPSPNQVVKTPNIDRVAHDGVLFRHAFVCAPSCTPCRSALLSGQYFYRTGRGAILLGAQWNPTIPTFPLLLRDAGYHIGKSYKVWSPGTPADAPYGGQQYAYEKAGRAFNDFSENATKMVQAGESFAAARDKMLGEVRDNFSAFLADRPAGKPFCFWFGPTNVHRAWVKGSGKALWGIDPASLEGKLPPFLPEVPEVREDFADYLGEIQAFDAAVGVLLARLAETGELQRTLVVISGDHGAPGFTNGKCNLYDFGVGVSLAASGPGIPAGRVLDDFVNLMDLAPTFLEFGGVTPPEVMTGHSLAGVLRSKESGLVDRTRTFVITGRERHVADAREGNLPYPQRALRTQDFLYIRNFAPDRWPMGSPKAVSDTSAPGGDELARNTMVAFTDMDASPTKSWLVAHRQDPQWQSFYDRAFAKRPAEELYDLHKDPQQMTNVADDPSYARMKQLLADGLLKELRETGDPRVTGDGGTFDRSPYSDPVGRKK